MSTKDFERQKEKYCEYMRLVYIYYGVRAMTKRRCEVVLIKI